MEQQILAAEQDSSRAFRIDIYALLARLFQYSADADILDWLSGLEIPTDSASNKMQQGWQGLTVAAQDTTAAAQVDEYQRLFIGVGRGEILPFGSWYLCGAMMDRPLAELRQELASLGFERHSQVKEPEDHISAILEVMMLLLQEGSLSQQQGFFNRYIGSWLEAFFRDLIKIKPAGFYTELAKLGLQFIKLEQIQYLSVKNSQ